MKKIILTLIVIAFTLSLFGTTIHVPGDYPTIQAAINAASDGDIIIADTGNYQEDISFLGKSLTLASRYYETHDEHDINNTTISNTNNSILVEMSATETGSLLCGFTIKQGQTGVNVIGTGLAEIDHCVIKDNHAKGISVNFLSGTDKLILKNVDFLNNYLSNLFVGGCSNIEVDNSTFYGSVASLGINAFGGQPGRSIDITINNTTFEHMNYAIAMDLATININNSFFSDNSVALYYIGMLNTSVSLNKVTLAGNESAFSGSPAIGSNLHITNSVVWDNTYLHLPASNTTVTYSDIEGGFTGTGNIKQDPVFCMDNDYKYHLEEASPCIDAGDPNDTSGDVRIDMGCYETTTDIKSMQGLDHINWVSFPRLQRTGDNPYDGPTLFNNTISFPEFFSLYFNNHQDLYGVPDNPNYWVPAHYPIRSSKGYKIDLTSVYEYHLLPEEGTRLDSSFVIHLDAGENWVGYWLPGSENWSDALGICKDAFTQIKAENWTMTKVGGSWWGPSNATFTYGKGYVMYVDRDAHPDGIDFYWNITFHTGGRYKKATPENFTYQEKPDYEVIDIQSIEGEENIDEIGAFVNGVCVGASKVEEYPVQILAYTEDANKGGDDNTLYFEVVSGKGTAKKINDIYEYNPKTDKYEKAVITAGNSREHLITLGKNDYTEHPVNLNLSLNNYPNPFNPETQISFTLPQDENIKIEIYNIKGQKVKTLANGKYQKGNQTITWKGLNNNGKKVSSGIYLYKLITKDKTINKKMLMLK